MTDLPKVIRFADLKAAGVVGNRVTLRRWQENPNINFPLGRLIGPNTRIWTQSEIQDWIASRPADNTRALTPEHREHLKAGQKRRRAAEKKAVR